MGLFLWGGIRVLGGFWSDLFSQNPCFKCEVIFSNSHIFYVIWILPRSVFCLPGLRRKSLNVSADVDATPGVPGLADFGISKSHFLGDRLFGGGPILGSKNVPISTIYREGVEGDAAVTTRRGGGYRTHTPYPRLVPSTIGPGVSGDDFQ